MKNITKKARQYIFQEFKPKSMVYADIWWLVIDKETDEIISVYSNGEDFDTYDSEEAVCCKLIK